MLRMLDRHLVQELLRAQVPARDVAQQVGTSLRTVRRIAREERIAVTGQVDDVAARRARQVGRPGLDAAIPPLVRGWLEADPTLPPGEVWRKLREAGHRLGLSTTYRVIGAARQALPAEVLVRFEGVAGEFAQFAFGQVDVRLTSGARRRIHFEGVELPIEELEGLLEGEARHADPHGEVLLMLRADLQAEHFVGEIRVAEVPLGGLFEQRGELQPDAMQPQTLAVRAEPLELGGGVEPVLGHGRPPSTTAA